MRHRHESDKLKLAHTCIGHLRRRLEQLAEFPIITSLIPGRISHVRRSQGRLRIITQYETQTGLKLVAKEGSAVQEVFVVTNDRAAVIKLLEEA